MVRAAWSRVARSEFPGRTKAGVGFLWRVQGKRPNPALTWVLLAAALKGIVEADYITTAKVEEITDGAPPLLVVMLERQ